MTSFATSWWGRSWRRTTTSTPGSRESPAVRPATTLGDRPTPMSIEVLNESGHEVDAQRLAALSRFVMDRMRVHPLAELCIKAVDEPTIAVLNEQWMEKEGPTDVLAFPMDELRPGL